MLYENFEGDLIRPIDDLVNKDSATLSGDEKRRDLHGRLTGYVNRKKKKTVGEVVTEEEVKFQGSFKR